MFLAAARRLAEVSPSRSDPNGPLLPLLTAALDVSASVAEAVAVHAQAEGLADSMSPAELQHAIRATMWSPMYHPYSHVKS
jgi:malate dehydrogenase (oxaloacetate-decarboxylating)